MTSLRGCSADRGWDLTDISSFPNEILDHAEHAIYPDT
jgi:hypothetical protein